MNEGLLSNIPFFSRPYLHPYVVVLLLVLFGATFVLGAHYGVFPLIPARENTFKETFEGSSTDPYYTVDRNSTHAWATKYTGEVQFESVNVSYTINSALEGLTSGRNWIQKVAVKGNYEIGDNSSIEISSYTWLEFDGKITYTSVDKTRNVLTNSDHTRGNIYIIIQNAHVDGVRGAEKFNAGPNWCYEGCAVYFRKVNYSRVCNLVALNMYGCAISSKDCWYCQYFSCYSDNCGGFAAYEQTGEHYSRYIGCIANNSVSDGFDWCSGCESLTYIDCIAEKSGGYGFVDGGLDPLPYGVFTFTSCKAIGSYLDGFGAASNAKYMFSACVALNNKENGFSLQAEDVAENCLAIDDQETPTQNYGFQVQAGGIVSKCVVDGYETGGIDVQNNGIAVYNSITGGSKTTNIVLACQNGTARWNDGFNPYGLESAPVRRVGDVYYIGVRVHTSPTRNIQANKLYVVTNCDLLITVADDGTWGTGERIRITDDDGNLTITDATTMTAQFVPVGYIISFGNFTVRPTITVHGL